MGRLVFQRQRRGAVVIVALVCLAIAAAMSVVVVRQLATERQASQTNLRRAQAAWLAEAGVERAAARLAADPNYAGETWTVSPGELGSGDGGSGDGGSGEGGSGEGGVVKIEVQVVKDQPARRSVRVEADYPDAPERRCRHIKRIVVDRD